MVPNLLSMSKHWFSCLSAMTDIRRNTMQICWTKIKNDGIAQRVVGIGQKGSLFSGDSFELAADSLLPDGDPALADIMVAQTIALLCS